jgi:glycosyltransferase involved in cell wall biosynthesis
MTDLTVIIPAYNESELLSATLGETIAWLTGSGLHFQIVVVDDGSSDQTYTIAQGFARQNDRICPVRSERNQGKGFALKFGTDFATGRYVAYFDADLDISPGQIGVLWTTMEETGADAVVGSKRHPASRIDYPFTRQVISAGYYAIMRLLFGLPLHDTQTGIKLFRREMLMNVLPRLLIKRFAFDLELLACAHRLGYHIVEAPVVLQFNRPENRITWQDIRTVGVDTLAIFYRARLLRYYDD